jgi:hypothetical protein
MEYGTRCYCLPGSLLQYITGHESVIFEHNLGNYMERLGKLLVE